MSVARFKNRLSKYFEQLVPFGKRTLRSWISHISLLIMKLLVKNMVSLRCKLIVKSTLEKMGLHFTVVELGEVEITEELSSDRLNELKVTLLSFGLELI